MKNLEDSGAKVRTSCSSRKFLETSTSYLGINWTKWRRYNRERAAEEKIKWVVRHETDTLVWTKHTQVTKIRLFAVT